MNMIYKNKKLRFILPTFLTLSVLSVQAEKKPNVIIIFTDDQGYNDLSCYGSKSINTPNIDKMAEDGIRLTSFYVSSPVSSASRAGLLTGKMNIHNGVTWVFWPGDKGMSGEQVTIAEGLKEVGYTTGCFGKWHLGDVKESLPINQGFDRYYGIPYSNDMYIGPTQSFSPDAKFRDGYTLDKALQDQEIVRNTKSWNKLLGLFNHKSPLMRDSLIIEYPCDQSTTTRRYFDEAMKFIKDSGDTPFFAYITPNMPHFPLYPSEQFKGKSKGGTYGDVVEEIDWNVGRLLKFLEKNNLDENTIVIFSSDNGPWLDKKENGGSAYPLRDGKFSIYEGGVRTPCIIRWKGTAPQNVVSDKIIASIDIFPTLMSLAGNKKDYKVDGIDLSQFIKDPSLTPRNHYFYVKDGEIKGVRKDEWVYLPQTGGRGSKKEGPIELFNINYDIRQEKNISEKYPQIIKELDKIMRNQK